MRKICIQSPWSYCHSDTQKNIFNVYIIIIVNFISIIAPSIFCFKLTLSEKKSFFSVHPVATELYANKGPAKTMAYAEFFGGGGEAVPEKIK